MHTRVARSAVLSVIVSAGLFLAACGSGGDDSAPTDSAAESADVTDTTIDVQKQLDAAKDADNALGNANCAEAATAFGAVAMSASQAFTDPDAFSLDDLKNNIDIARKAIPAELEDEFDLYADLYVAYGEAIADIGGLEGLADPANTEKLNDLQDKLDDTDIAKAGDTLSEYFANECTFLGGE